MAEYDLSRFHRAQELDYAQALAEVRRGHKTTHWIWYIFPQLAGLSRNPSRMTQLYSIRDLGEARAYIQDELLRKRLEEICGALLELETSDPYAVFGGIDAKKVLSCVTLFYHASDGGEIYKRVLDRFYAGHQDEKTLKLLGLKEREALT